MKNVAKILIVTLMFLLTVSGVYFTEQRVSAQAQLKNIQVLKDVPADQIPATMSFIAGSLGVTCGHCHTVPAFDKDDKPAKLRAREMMLMMRKINADNFKGATVVNCATCHQGKTHTSISTKRKPPPRQGHCRPPTRSSRNTRRLWAAKTNSTS
jgi:hypothetical protein